MIEELRNRYRRKYGLPKVEGLLRVTIGFCECKGCYMQEKAIVFNTDNKSVDEVWQMIVTEKQKVDNMCKKGFDCACHVKS